MQEFFLKHYKIIAIIGSKVERWFEDADINTCIVILEKCSGDERKNERNDNLVRFVYLKKPLRYFIPPAQDIWEKQVERLSAIRDKFIRTIIGHTQLYEGDDFRIFPKKQKALWEEGYDRQERKYTGAKWGKYLRAPDIFFTILEKGKGKLVPLKQIADVRRGFTTGANEFFYLEPTDKRAPKGLLHVTNGVGWEGFIEERFLKPVLRRPKECESIQLSPDSFRFRVFLCHEEKANLRKTYALRYIEWGEERGFDKRSTCSSRVRWYDLGEHDLTNIAAKMTTKYRHYFPGSPKAFLVDHRFYEVRPLHDDLPVESLLLSLNSAVTALYLDSTGRTYGGGGGPLDIMVYEMKEILIVDPRQLHPAKSLWGTEIAKRPILHFWKVVEKRDRQELDKFIMGNILGLTEEEQVEVHRAVVDLVKSRMGKAKSFGNHKNTKEGIDIDLLAKIITEKVGEETLGKFYQENIVNQEALSTKSLPKDIGDISIKYSLFGWRLYSGKQSVDCASELEARYLKVWLEAGVEKIKVPQDESYLRAIVPQLEGLKQSIDEIIEPYLNSIVNVRTRERILHQLWAHITKGVVSD